ncbi:MAG: DAK2 domain-containing protein [Actinobacteria bacterium]|nr:DAK2 domain-containing protein [Actinomycetota bacterium]
MEGATEKHEGPTAKAVTSATAGTDLKDLNTDLKTVVAAAHAVLAAHSAEIDALNVYPVPDGDTGINMLLTLRSVLEEVSSSPDSSSEAAARNVSRAVLMGARGNSGVILSQVLRGACDVLGKAKALDAGTISAALAGAKERAYATVREPVEGTMLSVIKDAAAVAQSRVEQGERDPLEVLRAVAREARVSVERTPELLGVLKEAGVVDAGGLGISVILDGLVAALSGEEPVQDLPETKAGGEGLRETIEHSAEEAWGYCTEFIVSGFSGDEREFEARIRQMGKSVLVIPDGELVKVHLHTQDPGGALTYAGSFGRLSGVKADDMEAQTRARANDGGDPSQVLSTAKLGVVAASRGAGNRTLLQSMGAVVVEGGQGANPSAEDFVRAVEQAAADLRCGEVTRAVREARIGGREVSEGAYIGLLDGELVAVEEGVEDAAVRLVEKMLEHGADVVTLLRGYGMDERSARKVAERIKLLYNGVEVEVKDGGQPLYPLQVVAE